MQRSPTRFETGLVLAGLAGAYALALAVEYGVGMAWSPYPAGELASTARSVVMHGGWVGVVLYTLLRGRAHV